MQHGTDELPCVLTMIAAVMRELHAEGGGETLYVFDPSFVQTIGIEIHARAAS